MEAESLTTPTLVQQDEGFELRFVTFQELKSSLAKVFGTAAPMIMYDAGIEPGRSSCLRLKERFESKDELVRSLIKRKTDENWGTGMLECANWKIDTGVISFASCFEARRLRATDGESSKNPSCDFMRGYLTGFFSELAQREMLVTEEKCARRGRPRCEFVFRPATLAPSEVASQLAARKVPGSGPDYSGSDF